MKDFILNPSDTLYCDDLPCADVMTKKFTAPGIQINPDHVKILMISEAPSPNPDENIYSPNNHEYMQPTVQIFNDAGLNISSMKNIIEHGIYITTAIKCPKRTLSISANSVRNCTNLLEEEIDYFPNLKVIILNGDIAIRALNYISKKRNGERVIPAGSTYKIRKNVFHYGEVRVFPSYILTGRNILIEKSKRRMITEDLEAALRLI